MLFIFIYRIGFISKLKAMRSVFLIISAAFMESMILFDFDRIIHELNFPGIHKAPLRFGKSFEVA
jgi:hypothetical protein